MIRLLWKGSRRIIRAGDERRVERRTPRFRPAAHPARFREPGYRLARWRRAQPERGVVRCQPLSFLGYVAANCYNALATLPEVDAKRVGIVGHSYGGKWALFGSCFYDKFACAVWSDPGIAFDEARPNVNYWEPWYLGQEPGRERKRGIITPDSPRTGAYAQLVEQGRDLHELHALMAPRPFLVSGGAEDFPRGGWP